MKKKILVLSITALVAVTMLTGCGSDSNDSSKADNKTQTTDNKTSEAYSFTYNGTKITVDEDFAPVLEKLGDPVSYYESPSCAAEGIGKTYTYADFVIDTYPDGDKDLILSIMLKTDNVKTEEGIDLSMTKDAVKEKYGEPSDTTDIAYIYKKGNMKLNFIFEGDSMTSIQYDSSLN